MRIKKVNILSYCRLNLRLSTWTRPLTPVGVVRRLALNRTIRLVVACRRRFWCSIMTCRAILLLVIRRNLNCRGLCCWVVMLMRPVLNCWRVLCLKKLMARLSCRRKLVIRRGAVTCLCRLLALALIVLKLRWCVRLALR